MFEALRYKPACVIGLFDIYMSKGDYIIVRRCAPYRQIVTSELVRLLFALTLEHVTELYVWCLACCRKEWEEALYDKENGARIVGGG
jgi:hypothetical protein